MDIDTYIQSGIVEQYVLGLANAEEAAELEQLRKQYAALDEAITAFEILHEEKLLANQMLPPALIKQGLEKKLFDEKQHSATTIAANIPQAKPTITPTWKYLAAASIILLAVSIALNFHFYSDYKDSKEQYENLLAEQETLEANNASFKQALQVLQDTAMMHVPMKGMPGKEQNLATVLWNKDSKDVYLYMNNMEEAPSGKQYQLWAIINGKPVSIGMVKNCNKMCKMDKVNDAQAFAISLENEGGSPTPTPDEVYVMGKV